MANVPGAVAKHAIIKPACRSTHGDLGAFQEASEVLQREYLILLDACGSNPDVGFHLVLTLERPRDIPTENRSLFGGR